MNGQGDMALSYSASNGSNPAVFPSVSYTGRLASDPLGMMLQGEANIVTGTGSQTTTLNRWGDYTSLTVDPTDDCTFWAVNEWVPSTSSIGWVLRIGSFQVGNLWRYVRYGDDFQGQVFHLAQPTDRPGDRFQPGRDLDCQGDQFG